jgi:hypothetical protein
MRTLCETESSLPRPQERPTGPCSKTHGPISYNYILFFKANFSINLPYIGSQTVPSFQVFLVTFYVHFYEIALPAP